MKLATRLKKDFMASSIRSQVLILRGALDGIENEDPFDDEFIEESIRRVEANLRRLRRTSN